MLSGIRIKNFKSLRDTGEIAIKPLTLFVGPNSAGKSSILQTLLMLKQTAESGTTPLLIHGQYTKDIDLGSYTDFVYNHNLKEKITFEITYETKQAQNGYTPIKVTIVFGYTKRTGIYIDEYIAEDLLAGKCILNAKRKDGEYIIKSDLFPSKHKTYTKPINNIFTLPFIYYQPTLKVIKEQLKEIEEHDELGTLSKAEFDELLTGLNDLIPKLEGSTIGLTNLFKEIFYIGPLRKFPQRFYPATGETHRDVGTQGEYSIDVLYLDREKKRLIKKVAEWFKEFGIGLEVDLKQIHPRSSHYNLLFEDPQTKIKVNIADVGFGASQILPIIIEGFCTPKNATIIIEQPEIHLHPKAQAILGDLVIDIAQSGKNLLIETHSEHIISRIQRRVAEGKVKNTDIVIYWCQPSLEGTNIKELKLDSLGQREGWPEGFFAEGFEEAMAHLEVLAGKKAAK